MKDLFSDKSEAYERYRPLYPKELVGYIESLVPRSSVVWDCGAGTGQMTRLLAPHFSRIEATDISAQQLDEAPMLPNVSYSVQSAEKTTFADHSFDLIVVAQAIHWFDFDQFYREVRRVLKPNGKLVITGYGLVRIDPLINQEIDAFYHSIKNYWDPERRFLDDRYQTIPFPFYELDTPSFSYEVSWNLDHFIQYLATWSAVKKMAQKSKTGALEEFKSCLQPLWNASKVVTFPTLLRVGRL